VPHSTSLSLIIECTDPTGGDLYCNGIVLPRDTLTAINIHGNICSADAYQYGYNGQIKDNEWAGLGNHTSAKFWEYDTRTGRRWNRDPKPQMGLSDYSTFLNNPIVFPDPLGDVVVDRLGHPVKVTVSQNFNGSYSAAYSFAPNTPESIKDHFNSNGKVVIDNMIQIPTGREQVAKVIETSDKVHTTYSPNYIKKEKMDLLSEKHTTIFVKKLVMIFRKLTMMKE
jgi:RHS repeat-associated protein